MSYRAIESLIAGYAGLLDDGAFDGVGPLQELIEQIAATPASTGERAPE